jgi:3-oxoacyl-[acyl-carrier protein] reductase
MDLLLNGKVALVCASGAGIGKSIATSLAEEGVHVSIFSRTQNAIEATAKEISAIAKGKVIYNTCNLARPDEISRVYKDTVTQLGPIDILINNQGGPAPGNLDDVSEDQIEDAITTNIRSVFQLTKLCLPSMKKRKFGRIVNILSISAKEPLPGMLLSNTVRPAILGFAKTLATEYAPFGVTINSLLPSAVLTQRALSLIQKQAREKEIDIDVALSNAAASLPIGRLASPEEIAQLAVFLCSPQASYISGTAIPIDAGASHTLF